MFEVYTEFQTFDGLSIPIHFRKSRNNGGSEGAKHVGDKDALYIKSDSLRVWESEITHLSR